MLKLHNTLTKKLEPFEPITPNKVGMYHCGPTVYDYAHIGNLRAYVFADTLRRTFEYLGYTVDQVINVTDVGHLSSDGDEGEDKMTKALKREGKPMTLAAMREVADFYFGKFKADLQSLNIETPTHFPFASDHIPEMIALIEKLSEKGFTYTTSDGIYFDISKDPAYGKLGGLSGDDDHSRIAVNNEKKNARDFAVWKFNDELGFEAPFGNGFPGWHIECSAMSMKYLGETFDIHTGGIDHIAIHHNNEIAQSECATGKPFAHYWMHSAFVTMENGKMAKSSGEKIQLETLEDKKILPISYRYWLLQAKYSTTVNFSWDTLIAAQSGYLSLLQDYKKLQDGGAVNKKYFDIFQAHIENDLDTPQALALIRELLKDDSISDKDKKKTIKNFDRILGLNLEVEADRTIFTEAIGNLPDEIQVLISKREKVRSEKDFATSDKLRDELKEKGYLVEDKPEGPQISLVK